MGTYFHWEPMTSVPATVRAPHTTFPILGNWRRQLIAQRIELAVLQIGQMICRPSTWLSVVSIPAGAFHTPRLASVEA